MAACHLAILKKPYLDWILTGKKTIEARLTKTKREPFNSISPRDKIFLKLSSGPVCATAVVEKVKFFENLSADRILNIKQKYNHQILGDDKYWQSRINSSFAVLIWLKDIHPIEPVMIDKKDWLAWVILTNKKKYGLVKTTHGKMLKKVK